MRYYKVLIFPVLTAIFSVILAGTKIVKSRSLKLKPIELRLTLLFSFWWLLDMAFVWISPRSYEQYYLPLNASSAVLLSFLIYSYQEKLSASPRKARWFLLGFGYVCCAVAMSWNIFFGLSESPHSGSPYPQKRRGYLQKFNEISVCKKYNFKSDWENAGEYIQQNSCARDKIYVWGWYPGIYVKAQRLSTVPKAFLSEMHTMSPEKLAETVKWMLSHLDKSKPLFIVDTHKTHFPWDRPPLELWPSNNGKFLPDDIGLMEIYNREYSRMLENHIGKDEAKRYKAMQPFREFVMSNYNIEKRFGQHVLFKLNLSSQL